MRAVFLTFAGERLGYGTGHLMETLLVANAWRNRSPVDIRLLINNFPPCRDFAEEANFPYLIYTDNSYGGDIFQGIPELIREIRPHAIIANLPTIFQNEIEKLAQELTPFIVVLDNDENQFFKVAALINHNINQDQHFYDGMKGTQCYIGSDYVPLDHEELDNAKCRYGSRFSAGGTVVTFGGTNPNNLTLRVLQALDAIDSSLRVNVVLGRGTPGDMCDKIQNWVRESGNCWNFYYGLPHKDFLELLASSRYAVSAPGNTLYELCYLGIPTLAIAENEPTLRVANAFAIRGWCRSAGIGTKLSQDELILMLREFLGSAGAINPIGACKFDGRGVERIIDVILNVIIEQHGSAVIAGQ